MDVDKISIQKKNNDPYSEPAAEVDSEEKCEEVSVHEEDSLKVTVETDNQSDEKKDMEYRLLSKKEMMKRN